MSQVVSFNSEGVTIKLDYDGGTNAIFIGEAMPGTLTSNARWRIRKLTYDGNDHVTDVQWANAEAIKFTVKYDDRASLNYS